MKYEPNVVELRQRLSWLAADTRPHFILNDADLEKADERPELALAKAALFSAHVIVLTQACSVLDPAGSHPATARRTWTGNDLKSRAAQLVDDRRGDEVFRDSFSLIPERTDEGTEDWEDEENWLPAEYHSALQFREVYRNEAALDIRFSDPLLLFKWLECTSGGGAPPLAINLWLPELRGLSLETLLHLREDEREAFDRFHRAVNRVVSGLPRLASSERLKFLLQETDHEVREYERRLSEAKRQLSRSLATAAIGFAVVGCCIAVPSETAKMISAFIGSFQAKDFVQNLFRYRERVSDLHASDFYAAALAGQHVPRCS